MERNQWHLAVTGIRTAHGRAFPNTSNHRIFIRMPCFLSPNHVESGVRAFLFSRNATTRYLMRWLCFLVRISYHRLDMCVLLRVVVYCIVL